MLQGIAASGDLLDLGGVLAVGDGHDCLGAVDPVLNVAGGQQGGGGHGQRAELEQADHGDVPLGNARQHDEDAVALLDAELAEGVGEAVGEGLQVPEGVVGGFLSGGVDGEEGELGAVLSPLVDDVEAEVEELRDFEPVVAVGGLVIGHVGGGIRHGFTSNAGTLRRSFGSGGHFTINPVPELRPGLSNGSYQAAGGRV